MNDLELTRMLQRGIKFNKSLVNEKLAYYDMEFAEQEFMDRCELLRSGWKMELESLMVNVPDHKTVMDDVREMISG